MIVNLHVTHDCNLRCDYCYASPKRQEHMSVQTALAAIEWAQREAQRLDVIFFGGEPLLRRELIAEVVDHCERHARSSGHEVHFQIATNGLLLDQEFLEFAKHHRVSISLSLDGCREAHDKHRRLPGGQSSFDAVAERLPSLLQSHPYAHVQLVISPDTAPLLRESVGFVFAQGVRFVSTALDYTAPWDRRSMGRLEKAYRELGALYVDKTLAGDRFFLSCFDARIRTRVVGPCKPSERCSIGVGQVSVAPSGRLYPCVQFVGDDQDARWVIGDVARGFDAQARQQVHRQSEAHKPECQGCALERRCMNWCACVNGVTTGQLDRVSPVLCEHERLLIPIADGVGAKLFKRRSRDFVDKHYNAAFPILAALEDMLGDRGS